MLNIVRLIGLVFSAFDHLFTGYKKYNQEHLLVVFLFNFIF